MGWPDSSRSSHRAAGCPELPETFSASSTASPMRLVSQAGGTVTALSLAEQVNIEKTAAGNRLVSLQKKGYLQRVEQPHPAGDLFVDPRSVHLTSQKDDR